MGTGGCFGAMVGRCSFVTWALAATSGDWGVLTIWGRALPKGLQGWAAIWSGCGVVRGGGSIRDLHQGTVSLLRWVAIGSRDLGIHLWGCSPVLSQLGLWSTNPLLSLSSSSVKTVPWGPFGILSGWPVQPLQLPSPSEHPSPCFCQLCSSILCEPPAGAAGKDSQSLQ